MAGHAWWWALAGAACSESTVGEVAGDDDDASADCSAGADMVMASAMPEPGAPLIYSFRAGGCLDEQGGIDGSWDTVVRAQDTDEVLCALRYPFRSVGGVDTCASCELAWLVDWDAGDDLGSPFCAELNGYDGAEADLSFYESMGFDTDEPMLWVREEGYDWETIGSDRGYALEQDQDRVWLTTESEGVFGR